MYDVLLDGRTMYVPDLQEYQLLDPKVEIGVNRAGTFEFTIYPSHPEYDKIVKLKSIIEVYQRGVLIFRGRPLLDSKKFDDSKVVHCEGTLAYLNDSIQRPYDFSGGVREYLEFLVNRHNSQVEDEKKFVVGKVTVTDPNDYIVRSDSTYKTTWELIADKLVKYLGGYILLRRENETNYIDYLIDSDYKSGQTIELGTNLLDINESIRGDEVFTALIPVGATLEDDDGNEYPVMINEVNDGLDYVYHAEGVSKYGWIFKTVEYPNITLPENLKKRAIQDLGDMQNIISTIEIKALDLNLVDDEVHRFRFFEYVRVVSKPHGIDDYYLILNQVIHLDNPAENTITIGKENAAISDKNVDLGRELEVIRDKTITNNNSIKETYKDLSLKIIESAEGYSREISEIISSELDQIRSETSTIMEQTNESFEFTFNKFKEQIDEQTAENQLYFEDISKYIRFIDGKIILGERGNQLELRISNDRIHFIQNNNEVAYFTNNKLYVTNAEILEELRLGEFGFYPRDNGSLSFLRVPQENKKR